MTPIADFMLIVAMVAVANSSESPTCDQTSLLQVGNIINRHRGSVATPDTESEAKHHQSLATGLGNSKQQKTAEVAADKVSQNPSDPAAALVGQVFKLFATGMLKHGKCKTAMANLWTTDAVVDLRGPQDATYFKKYDPGPAGVCEYFDNTNNVRLQDVKGGTYSMGDKLVTVWNYIPGAAGNNATNSSQRVAQYNMFSFNKAKSKVAGLEVLFDKPEVLDRMKYGEDAKTVETAHMGIAAKMHDAFLKQKFVGGRQAGSLCQKEASQLFAKDAEVDGTPYFQKFTGLDGVCAYFEMCYRTHMHNLTTNMYARGKDVVMVLKYLPGLSNLAIKASSPVTQFNVFRFHKDTSKITDFLVYFDNPAIFTELTQATQAQMMSGVVAAMANKDKMAVTIEKVVAGAATEENKGDEVAILDEGNSQEEREEFSQSEGDVKEKSDAHSKHDAEERDEHDAYKEQDEWSYESDRYTRTAF